jgi:integrase/recombinase XerD
MDETLVWSLASVRLSTAADLAVTDRFGLDAVSPATARWLRSSVRQLIGFLERDPSVEELTPVDVQRWVQADVARGLAAISVNSRLRALKTLYSRLQRNGIVGFNPAAPVHFLPEPPARPRAVARDDYLAMRQVARHARDQAIVDVFWASGCRLGGLLSMRTDRMEHWVQDGRDCYALLVVEKFARPRWVYVGREPLESEGLSAWLAERPLVGQPWLWLAFAPPYGRLAAPTVEGLLRRLRLDAGIPDGQPCNAHAFRHAYAIRMLDEGEDPAAVSAWLGHHSPEFTMAMYVRRSERQLREKYFSRS